VSFLVVIGFNFYFSIVKFLVYFPVFSTTDEPGYTCQSLLYVRHLLLYQFLNNQYRMLNRKN